MHHSLKFNLSMDTIPEAVRHSENEMEYCSGIFEECYSDKTLRPGKLGKADKRELEEPLSVWILNP